MFLPPQVGQVLDDNLYPSKQAVDAGFADEVVPEVTATHVLPYK